MSANYAMRKKPARPIYLTNANGVLVRDAFTKAAPNRADEGLFQQAQ
jgi:hypothetical protein